MTQLPDKIKSIANCDIKIQHESGRHILIIKFKSHTVKLPILPVGRLNKDNINATINQYRALNTPTIIFANHINLAIAKQLHANKILFIDLNGNIFIDSPKSYIFITGEKPIRAKRAPATPFSVAGIKLIFALLTNPGLESKPYREVAEFSNVSLGSVDTIIRNLTHHNFLILAKNQKRKLVNKAELLNRWCMAFAEKLQTKLILAMLSCDDKQWWKKAKLDPLAAVWSGELAAAKLTKYLKPEKISIYAENSLPELQAKYALRRSNLGDIVIYKKFWNFQSKTDRHLAPELLVYAELINSGESRNIETARMIYEKYLTTLIQ